MAKQFQPCRFEGVKGPPAIVVIDNVPYAWVIAELTQRQLTQTFDMTLQLVEIPEAPNGDNV